MAMIKQELRAMLFGSDWKIMGGLNNFSRNHINLNAARRATILAHSSFYNQGRFLAERFQGFPQLRRDRSFNDDALHDSAAVAKLGKHQLAARTQVIKPAFERYFFADMFR